MPQVLPAVGAAAAAAGAQATAGAAFAVLMKALVVQAFLVVASKLIASRPPNAVTPSRELLARCGHILRPKLQQCGLENAHALYLSPRMDFQSSTLAAAVTEGDCLTPEFPSGSVMFYDSAIEPRTGDLAIVETWEKSSQASRHSVLGSMSLGGLSRERVLLAKYVEESPEGWICHSNDEPFMLRSPMRLAGTVVMAVVLSDGASQLAVREARARLAASDAEIAKLRERL